MKRFFFFVVFSPWLLWAQLSVKNLAEYQLGNLPNAEPGNLSTLFNQMDLSYRQGLTTVGVRWESFQSTDTQRSYDHLAQRYVQWQDGPFKVRIGNFYTTLGRGLVLRAFELPGVIFEQREFRRRYAYYRDIDGVLAEATWNRFEFTLLYGSPLNETLPPGVEQDRHSGVVQGGQVKFRPFNWLMLGDAYLRAEIDRAAIPKNEMNSLFGEINLSNALRQAGLERSFFKIYGEHARSNAQFDDFFSFSDDKAHATYVSANLSYQKFGLSAEYKDYVDFENSINVPPIGYTEHSYYLLNRSTHELLAQNESGYQFEATYRVHDNLFLLVNTAHAVNDLFAVDYEFDEKMFEATFSLSEALYGKAFYNLAKDELLGDLNRNTGGINLDWAFSESYALTVDAQHQNIDRGFAETVTEKFDNSYLALTFSSSPNFSLSLIGERSTDSGETDDPSTRNEIETAPKYWLSMTGAYQINMNHEISFFYGARRGGLACTSGTCYEVLPFEGLELRWIAHF